MPITTLPRTGTFAWGQSSSSLPLLATGTAAGALDESFSSEGKLEFWDVYPDADKQPSSSSSKHDDDGFELGGEEKVQEPRASFGVDSRSVHPSSVSDRRSERGGKMAGGPWRAVATASGSMSSAMRVLETTSGGLL